MKREGNLIVNHAVRKKDAMQLVTGQPVYMDDLAPQNCLIVKLLRSPYANAIVQEVNTTSAMRVPGIEVIYTWRDIDQNGRRYTQAGQTYPEASPYDRLIIDRHVRFIGDVVAIVAGKDEACVTLQRTIRSLSIRRKIGRVFVRSERTTSAISVPMQNLRTVILTRFWQIVTL